MPHIFFESFCAHGGLAVATDDELHTLQMLNARQMKKFFDIKLWKTGNLFWQGMIERFEASGLSDSPVDNPDISPKKSITLEEERVEREGRRIDGFFRLRVLRGRLMDALGPDRSEQMGLTLDLPAGPWKRLPDIQFKFNKGNEHFRAVQIKGLPVEWRLHDPDNNEQLVRNLMAKRLKKALEKNLAPIRNYRYIQMNLDSELEDVVLIPMNDPEAIAAGVAILVAHYNFKGQPDQAYHLEWLRDQLDPRDFVTRLTAIFKQQIFSAVDICRVGMKFHYRQNRTLLREQYRDYREWLMSRSSLDSAGNPNLRPGLAKGQGSPLRFVTSIDDIPDDTPDDSPAWFEQDAGWGMAANPVDMSQVEW
ncbi:uncharacterized protein F4822DRAFT_426421 [Hypoxylon trugodes]|uniref:uncharacterized protein n=1 Tax=Hypoxylon trugodes TaxID=326681 RepID=UPI00219B8D12|nr:uncharacterized protein F4822DRAFT_426421 [Hypoxylon trugodes]KAI1390573.1 hypothetical protein F4822DRAFT_426421 [Hypoxylon trugodes]